MMLFLERGGKGERERERVRKAGGKEGRGGGMCCAGG